LGSCHPTVSSIMSTKHGPDEAHGGAEAPGPTGRLGALSVVPGVANVGSVAPDMIKMRSTLKFTAQAIAEGVLQGERTMLGRAITLVESRRTDHQQKAREVLRLVHPHTGCSTRIGISGVPGVGKSTFIEALGSHLTAGGHRIAVLAIDPSSQVSHGSILGDKTRMEELAVDPNAFIRPSPASGTLGGVARRTREALLLCEAAGYDIVIVETVGVGQSETVVHSMVDFFLLLMLPNAGDQLQGMKRGIMEIAHAIVVNKAEGEHRIAADAARMELEAALHLMKSAVPGWTPPVMLCSALQREGIADIWATVAQFVEHCTSNGFLFETRRTQAIAWLRDTIQQTLLDRFHAHAAVRKQYPECERQVVAGTADPIAVAESLLQIFFDSTDRAHA
jgi:LAO/AO transport system kinase